ncbi:MAG TPA: choice-of-anchor B family protein, partial [Bacteroidetes bacterium]|nr:choice-of-anchor B family protein [Bacteroidota bacterium]
LAQSSLNVSLFGQLDPEPIHYAGSWAYIAPLGEEYALIGAYHGLSVISIDDSTNIYQVDWVTGPSSNWREITVIGSHAFVVSEGGTGDVGMQVIDLSFLPDSVSQVTTFDSTFGKSHIIEKDILGDPNYVYVCGSAPSAGRGVHIIDVSDPDHPREVAQYAPGYAHDCHVRGDTMYVAAIYDGYLDVVDISDKANPVRITQLFYPNAFTHSCWTSKDNTHLFVTDEVDGLLAHIYDIRDLNNITPVATYSANTQSLIHNCYIRGDFGFVTHNTEGLRILDLVKPDVPVEVGYYDTWAGASGGFHGLWSACPFFPSGKIIGANRHDGLYVWQFNETYAGRIYGLVRDSVTGLPLSAVAIQITQTGDSTLSRTDGSYAFGAIPAGSGGYSVTFIKSGYVSQSLNTPLNAHDSLHFVVDLVPVGFVGTTPALSDEALVFPTKCKGLLKVRSASNFKSELLIFDVNGKLQGTWPIPGPAESHIVLDALPNGVYLFKLSGHQGLHKQGKFVLHR